MFVQAKDILKATRIGIAAAGNDCDTNESEMATITYGTAHRDSWTHMLAKKGHRTRYRQVNHTVISPRSGGLDGGNPITLNQPPAFTIQSMPNYPSSRPTVASSRAAGSSIGSGCRTDHWHLALSAPTAPQ